MQYINYSTETIFPINGNDNGQKTLALVNVESLVRYTEIICTDKKCKYPQLALRILNHIFIEIDKGNNLSVNARRFSQRFGVHYDTVTKCLKYLRSINALKTGE